MSVRGVDIKVGDKLRYLGHDPADTGELIWGRVYDVVDVDYDVIVIDTIDNGSWAIGDEYKNVNYFEKVEEEGGKSTLDLIANLAQEVAQLKRELDDLRNAMQTQAYAFDERIESIADDREALIEPEPVRKVVYEYERYYD